MGGPRLLAVVAAAQTPPSVRIGGKIAALTGPVLTIDTREGSKVDVTLKEPLSVLTVKPVPLKDIKPGAYRGIASRTGSDGKAEALEVLV